MTIFFFHNFPGHGKDNADLRHNVKLFLAHMHLDYSVTTM